MAGAQAFQRIGMAAARIHGRKHGVTGVGGACQRRAAEIGVDGGFKGVQSGHQAAHLLAYPYKIRLFLRRIVHKGRCGRSRFRQTGLIRQGDGQDAGTPKLQCSMPFD